MHVIITEWGDGTIGTTGPYRSVDDAKADLPNVVRSVADDDEATVVGNDEHKTIGHPYSDQIDVYVQEMGLPSSQYRVDGMSSQSRQTIAVDFDGVLHAYSQGWADGTIYDPPVEGSREALAELSERYAVVIYSARCNGNPDGRDDIYDWLEKHDLDQYVHDVTDIKPAAWLYIDDRALRYEGDWQTTLDQVHVLEPGRNH